MGGMRMTRKDALATLYTFWESFFKLAGQPPQYNTPASTWEEERLVVAGDAYQALLTLTNAIHGKAPLRGSLFLCDVCHLRYADGELVEEVGGLCAVCHKAHEQ